MLLFDVLAVAALLIFIFSLVIRRLRRPVLCGILLAAAAVLLLIHLRIEHNRWQMAPTYLAILLTLLLTVSLVWPRFRNGLASRRKTDIALAVLGVGLLLMTIAASWVFPVNVKLPPRLG